MKGRYTMGNAPSYNAGMFSGMDYNSLMNNPYLYYAMMSPNINFKAAQEKKTTNENAETASSAASNTGVVDYAAVQPDESNTGLWVTGAIGAAALIGCMAKGGGNPIKGAKALYQKFFKSAETKTSEDAKTVLSKMQAVKNGNGEIKLNVPDKTKTFAGNKIQAGVNEYGIQQAVSESRQAFNPEISAVQSFHITTPEDSYTVFIKNGEVTKVVSALMKKDEDVLARLTNAGAETSDAKILERFKKIAEELGKDPKEVDKSILKGVKNIRYSNKYGDDTLNMVMSEYGTVPKLQTLKTLEQFDKTSEVVKKYTPSDSEKLFTGELVQTTGLISKKGTLVDGVGVLRCDEEIVSGTRCFFEGDKLVKIVQGENTYTEGSFGFIDFVKNNEKAIEQFKKDVFVDKIASKIPNGSVIGTV